MCKRCGITHHTIYLLYHCVCVQKYELVLSLKGNIQCINMTTQCSCYTIYFGIIYFTVVLILSKLKHIFTVLQFFILINKLIIQGAAEITLTKVNKKTNVSAIEKNISLFFKQGSTDFINLVLKMSSYIRHKLL